MNRLTKRKRWLSIPRKLWIAKLNLKHTNDRVIINVFIYDYINNSLIIKLKNIIKDFFSNKLNLENYYYQKKQNNTIVTDINDYLSNDYNNEINNSIKTLIDNNKIKFFKNDLKDEMEILNLKRFISLNTLKFKNTLISVLQKFIGKIYNRKVVFNIILLKNFYLNTDILTKMLIHITRDRNKRIHTTLSKATSAVHTPFIQNKFITRINKKKYSQKVTFKDNTQEIVKDNLNSILTNYYDSGTNTEYEVLNTMKNKSIIGIRLQAAGRLTKRFTAQRSVKRIRYAGTLKNIDSSFRGISTQMLRKNRKNNIQFSKAKSENRIGSFGIKGWINSI